jgi:hypothetical protein
MLDTKGGRPEIKTKEAAALVGGMVTDLYAKWLTASQEVETLQDEMKRMAAVFAEERRGFEQQIRERDLKLDDLGLRERKLEEELRLEIVEGEAMRGELRQLRSIIESAASRVESAVMRDTEDRMARIDAKRRENSPVDVAAIEEALSRFADDKNASA